MKNPIMSLKLFFFGFVLFSYVGNAQNLDSIQQSIDAAANRTEKLDNLASAVEYLNGKNNQEMVKYVDQLLAENQKEELPKYQAIGLRYKAIGLYRDKNFSEAEKYFNQSSEMYLVAEDTATAYINQATIGVMRSMKGEFEQAHQIYDSLLQKTPTYQRAHAYTLNQKATAFHYMNKLDSAQVYYTTAIAAYKALNDSTELLRPMFNQSVLLLNQNKVDEALVNFKEIEIYQTKQNLLTDLMITSEALMATYEIKGDLENTFYYAEKYISLANQIDNTEKEISGLVTLSGLYDKNFDSQKALELAEEAYQKGSKGENISDVLNAANQYVSLLQKNEEFEKADGIFQQVDARLKEVSSTRQSHSFYTYFIKNEFALGRVEEAKELINKTRALEEEFPTFKELPYLDLFLAKYHLEKNEPQKALNLVEALDFSKLNQSRNYMQIAYFNKVVYQVYKAVNQSDKALAAFERHTSAQDSILNLKSVKTLTAQLKESEFKREQEKAELAYQFEIEQEKQYRKSANIGIGLLLLMLFFVGLSYYIKQKSAKLLAYKNKQLQMANQTNENLIYSLSHDVKGPLLGIIILLKKLNIEDQRLLKASDALKKQVQHVNQIVSNLLKVKIEESTVEQHIEKVEIESTIQKILENLAPVIQDKNLDVVVQLEDNLSLPISEQKLYIIMLNLVNNAIKFSANGSKIEVYSKDKKLFIKDYGEGISDEILEQIGKTKVKSDLYKEQNANNGFGLGLLLVFKMIERQSLKIDFKNHGQGAEIVLFQA